MGGMHGEQNYSKMMQVIAASCPRDFVVMELKSNLIKEEREKLLAKFPSFMFKKVACVAIGAPADSFTKYNEKLMLAEKQAKSDIEFKALKAKERQQKLMEKKKKEIEKQKKKDEKIKAKKLKEAQKKLDEQKKKVEKMKKEAMAKKQKEEAKAKA